MAYDGELPLSLLQNDLHYQSVNTIFAVLKMKPIRAYLLLFIMAYAIIISTGHRLVVEHYHCEEHTSHYCEEEGHIACTLCEDFVADEFDFSGPELSAEIQFGELEHTGFRQVVQSVLLKSIRDRAPPVV